MPLLRGHRLRLPRLLLHKPFDSHIYGSCFFTKAVAVLMIIMFRYDTYYTS